MNILISVSNSILSYASLSATVAHIINHYIQTDTLARQAQVSAEQAQHAYPRLLKNMLKELEHADIDAKLIEYSGYRHNMDDTMTDAFAEKSPSQLTHGVIQVGQMAIDLCKLRMGQHYTLPLSYPIKDAFQFWAAVVDRTHLVKMTKEEAALRFKQAMQQPANRQGGGSSYEETLLDFDEGSEGAPA
jgi:hypothetical protein